MTLTVCSQSIYDINPQYADIIYLILAIMYGFVAGFFVWSIVSMARKNRLLKSPALLLLYLCLVGILLMRLLYFLGGILICYSQFIYDKIISHAPGTLRLVAIFLYLSRVCVVLGKYESNRATCYKLLTIITLFASIFVPGSIMALSICCSDNYPNIVFYSLSVVLLILFVAVVVSCGMIVVAIKRTMAPTMKVLIKSYVRKWLLFNGVLTLLLVLWGVHNLNNWFEFLSQDKTLLYVVWTGLFLLFPEMLAAGTIAFVFFFEQQSTPRLSSPKSSYDSSK